MLITMLLYLLGACALVTVGFVLCALLRSGEVEDAYRQGWHDAEKHFRLMAKV